jgi:hypothetical protein
MEEDQTAAVLITPRSKVTSLIWVPPWAEAKLIIIVF